MARAYGRVSVQGMSNLLRALDAVGVEAQDQRKAMREGSKLLRDSLRVEAPTRSGALKSSARAGTARNRAIARIGNKSVVYARWTALSKKSPHRFFHYRALYGAKLPVVQTIARNLQQLINRHDLNR